MAGWKWMCRSALALGSVALLACSPSDDDADASAAADASRVRDGGADAAEPTPECNVTAPTQCPDPPVRYDDVEPIFMERCVPCHVGAPGGPWGLTSYSHVASWSAEIRGVMLDCKMPPADAGIEMSTGEREEILTWLRCGFPQ